MSVVTDWLAKYIKACSLTDNHKTAAKYQAVLDEYNMVRDALQGLISADAIRCDSAHAHQAFIEACRVLAVTAPTEKK